ncbi:TetR/AcrR family transcriptional regulator [uncultured Algibacter sp.]|uniref:TetR/AcrR family transcriptional regulator n=1 Tax=uncultured Algibacter sp. TaxID=298659 RepID=UPI00260968B2|nr:TetR/AcrR family transcriptional regulator [uncultured Algibacter sp.]
MPKVETFDRGLVIAQVTDVFHDKGFNATSMQDIVDATGLNRSSIYNSFENKHNLFLECLKTYKSKCNTQLSEKLSKASNPLESIELIFDIYILEMTKDEQDKGCLIVNCASEMANHDVSITNFLQKNQNDMLTLLEGLVSKAQQDHLINSKRTGKEYALYLYSNMQGFRMTGILISNKLELESIKNTIIQTLI